MIECNSKKDLHICFSADDNYVRYCGTAIASILLNAGHDESLHFHIIDGGISKKNRFRLEKIKKIRDFSIDFVKIDPVEFNGFPLDSDGTHHHLNIVTYYRVRIPSLFPHLEKVLYLDCDLIAMASIKPIFEIDLNGYYSAAVVDVYEKIHKKRLNMDESSYFNTGVLLIDCCKWRAEKIESRIFDWIRDNRELIRLADQDAINPVLAGTISALAEKFNVFAGDYDNGNYQEDPVIIHYVGNVKPWNLWTKKNSAKHYFEVLKKTPWDYTKYWQFFKNLPLGIFGISKKLFFRASPVLFNEVKKIYLKQKGKQSMK